MYITNTKKMVMDMMMRMEMGFFVNSIKDKF